MEKDEIYALVKNWCEDVGINAYMFKTLDSWFICELQTTEAIVTISFEIGKVKNKEDVEKEVKDQLMDAIEGFHESSSYPDVYYFAALHASI